MLDVRSALRRAARFHRHRIAVISEGRELTYEAAWDRGVRLANLLLDLGLSPGDRVAVLEDNCLASSDFFLATAIANLVRVPLYRRNSRTAHLHMIGHTSCRALVVDEEQYDEVAGFIDELPSLQHVVVRGPDYEDRLASSSTADPDPPIDLNDFYVIRHSAGTTGLPKGVAFSHLAWMNTARNWTYLLPPLELGDHTVHVAPISHGSGYLFMPTWLAGGCNILEPRFSPRRLLDLLASYGGYVFCVPTMVADLLALGQGHPDQVPDLKAVVVSGAPIRAQTAIAAVKVLGPKLYQMYGQTECVPTAFMGPREWFGDVPGSEPLRSCGRVMPYTELDIRGPTTHPSRRAKWGRLHSGAMGKWSSSGMIPMPRRSAWSMAGS